MLKSDCSISDCSISNMLIFKQLNPPKYRTYTYRRDSYMGERLSKAVLVLYDVHGIGILYERLIYNNENSVIFSKYSYLSNKQRESDRRKNMKRQKLRLNNRKKNVEDK